MEQDNKKDQFNYNGFDITEVNSYTQVKHKHIHYSVESSNTKEYDILLMTGNSQDNQKGSDKK